MENCKEIEFNKIGDESRGYLTALEEKRDVPFDIKRIYYVYGVPNSVIRGCHAHKTLHQLLVCVSGSLKVNVFDGKENKIIILDNPYTGLYIGPEIWREIYDYNKNTVLMVLASEYYLESDYIRDYDEFLLYLKNKSDKIEKVIIT